MMLRITSPEKHWLFLNVYIDKYQFHLHGPQKIHGLQVFKGISIKLPIWVEDGNFTLTLARDK